jgi:hypothetical protein
MSKQAHLRCSTLRNLELIGEAATHIPDGKAQLLSGRVSRWFINDVSFLSLETEMMDFYEENHQQYFNATVNIDPASFLIPFARYLAPGATILDVGLTSDVQYPFGRKQLHFFDPGQVEAIRQQQGLKEHTADTRATDFIEFLEKRDYTFSYKIIFLLGFLKICNERLESSLPELVALYQRFYQGILKKNGKNEQENCPYNSREMVDDDKALQRYLRYDDYQDLSPQAHSGKLSAMARMRQTECEYVVFMSFLVLLYVYLHFVNKSVPFSPRS